MTEVVIVAATRSAVGRGGGTLAHTHPADVLGPVQVDCLNRVGVGSGDVGQVVGGCFGQVGAQGMNITRTAWLSHGGDPSVGCCTVDLQCGSSQHAVNLAYCLIASGAEDIVLACGVESLSIVPLGVNAESGPGRRFSRSYFRHYEFTSQFEGAERIATAYGISRTDADEFGLESQLRTAAAQREGRFEAQIVPIQAALVDEDGKKTGETVEFSRDEAPRDTSIEALAGLPPVARRDGIHTAGTASPIADGAAAVLLMSAGRASELGLEPMARVAQTALAGGDPVLVYEGSIPATERALSRQGITVDDVDVFEINEGFASLVIAWQRAVGADPARTKPNGGAISLGHPVGASGCILVCKALYELERSDGEWGFVSVPSAGGLGPGTLLQRLG